MCHLGLFLKMQGDTMDIMTDKICQSEDLLFVFRMTDEIAFYLKVFP